MPSATHVQRSLVRYPLPNLRTVARALLAIFAIYGRKLKLAVQLSRTVARALLAIFAIYGRKLKLAVLSAKYIQFFIKKPCRNNFV